MDENEKWKIINDLDEELLVGGVMLSEWCNFIVCEADTAFASGANLASILTAVSGIETYLRSEHSSSGKKRLSELIDCAQIEADLKTDLHTLRKYRNKWVHVDSPLDDAALLEHPEELKKEVESMALFAVRTLRRTIYSDQLI